MKHEAIKDVKRKHCWSDRKLSNRNQSKQNNEKTNMLVIKGCIVMFITLFVLFALISKEASSAFLSGKVYDKNLKEMVNVLVKIDTTPKQIYLAKLSIYKFNVPMGNYTLEAFYYGHDRILYKKIKITIGDERQYNLDIVMDKEIKTKKELESVLKSFGLYPKQYLEDFDKYFLKRNSLNWYDIPIIIIGPSQSIKIKHIIGFAILVALFIIAFILIKIRKKKKKSTKSIIKMRSKEAKKKEKSSGKGAKEKNNKSKKKGKKKRKIKIKLNNIKMIPHPNINIVYEPDQQEEKKEKVKEHEERSSMNLDDIYKLFDIDEDLREIISFIYKQGKRTTQKEIRKNFPFSEAKISLMLTELEHKGLIEKFKKGKTNIIKLKLNLNVKNNEEKEDKKENNETKDKDGTTTI